MPFVQMDLGFGIAGFVEDLAALGGRVDELFERVPVGVIGIEVQRGVMFGAVFDEINGKRFETGMGGSADLEVREPFFEFGRDGHVEFVEFIEGAEPHAGNALRIGAVRLVPDLPVLDIEAETVGPAFGVVADDMVADVDPLVHVGGLADEILVDAVFDAGSEPVIDLGAAFDAVADIVVGLGEIIIPRIVGVGMLVSEDHVHVDEAHAGIFQRSVVEAGQRDVHLRESVADVASGLLPRQRRREIPAVELFEFARGGFGPYLDLIVFFHGRHSFQNKRSRTGSDAVFMENIRPGKEKVKGVPTRISCFFRCRKNEKKRSAGKKQLTKVCSRGILL